MPKRWKADGCIASVPLKSDALNEKSKSGAGGEKTLRKFPWREIVDEDAIRQECDTTRIGESFRVPSDSSGAREDVVSVDRGNWQAS